MTTTAIYTVVRIKSAVPAPQPGAPVLVMAVDNEGHSLEFRTTRAMSVGDRLRVSISAVGETLGERMAEAQIRAEAEA